MPSISTQSFGQNLFRSVAKDITSARSPSGTTVNTAELTVSVAALAVDGFTKADRQLLADTFSQTKLTFRAREIFTALTRGVDSVKSFTEGSRTTFSGTLRIVPQRFGIGGETPPSGYFLDLDQPIRLGGQLTKSLHIGWEDGSIGTQAVKAGDKLTVFGRLDSRTWGGTETAGGKYVELSGLSNVGVGEPTYDGREFHDAAGTKLSSAYLYNPMVADAPNTQLVFDKKTAWVGMLGGFIGPTMNPFHGFQAKRAVETPKGTDFQRAQDLGGKVVDTVTGKSLQDAGSGWYYNLDTNTAYKVNRTLEAVVRMAKGDVIGS
jgi:hypothetical protein